jgi:hypothetical protein
MRCSDSLSASSSSAHLADSDATKLLSGAGSPPACHSHLDFPLAAAMSHRGPDR